MNVLTVLTCPKGQGLVVYSRPVAGHKCKSQEIPTCQHVNNVIRQPEAIMQKHSVMHLGVAMGNGKPSVRVFCSENHVRLYVQLVSSLSSNEPAVAENQP